MIKINVNGRLTQDPQLNENRCSFNLAADSTHYNKQDRSRKSEFFRVTIWGKRGETAAMYLHKGDPVMISGDFYSDDYVGRDDKTHHQQYIENADFDFLPRPKSENSSNNFAPADEEDEDDLPFA